MIIRVRTGKQAQYGHAFLVERGRIGRQYGLLLNRDRQPDRHVAALNLAGPDRTRTHSLHDQLAIQSADHVHVQISGHCRLDVVLPARLGGQLGHEVLRAQQAEFFARPGCEDDIALELEFAGFHLVREVLGDFQQSRDARSIIVGPEVDHVLLIFAGQGVGRAALAEVIDVSSDDQYRRLRAVDRRFGSKHREHVASLARHFCDVNRRLDLNIGNGKTQLRLPGVEFVLQSLQFLVSLFQNALGQSAGHRNCGDANHGVDIVATNPHQRISVL